MPRNFVLDDEGDQDTMLTLLLTVVAILMSFILLRFRVAQFVFYPMPLLMFLVTRTFYKWHFRRLAVRSSGRSDDAA